MLTSTFVSPPCFYYDPATTESYTLSHTTLFRSTSREQTERHAEGEVGEHVVVQGPVTPARGAPGGDLAAHGLPVRPRQLTRTDHHARRRFRIPEPHLRRGRELGLRGIHQVQHDHVMTTVPQVPQGGEREVTVEQQVRHEHHQPPAPEQP